MQTEPARIIPGTENPQVIEHSIETDRLGASRSVVGFFSDRPNGGIVRLEEDASSKIQTIFFGIAGTCLGIATLVVALLTFRAMPKQRQSDPETPPLRDEDLPPSDGVELAQLQSPVLSEQTLGLDTVQPAGNIQCEEAATIAV